MENTKIIIIRCYFINSEDFMKEIIGERNIEYIEIPHIRENLEMFMSTDWYLKGDNENTINDLIESIQDKDYDIEIITDVVEMVRIIMHS